MPEPTAAAATTLPPPVFELVPAAAPVGTVTHGTMMFDGRERTYRLYVPASIVTFMLSHPRT